MTSLLSEPATVLLLLSLAAVLVVVEVALPTAGVAGTIALLLAAGGVVGLAEEDLAWWPLLGPTAAVFVWGVMIARRARTATEQLVAAALFVSGAVTFGLLADSIATAALGVALAVVVGSGFPRLHTSTQRLFDRPAQTGMEALLGVKAVVVAWDEATGAGVVRADGVRWNATAAAPLSPDDAVVVVGFTGMTVEVASRSPHST